MATDWAAAITNARREGVDLTAEMTGSDWAEYRAQCQSLLGTSGGQAYKSRALERVVAKQAIVDEAS